MKHSTLIGMDRLFKPLYLICTWLKSIFPRTQEESDHFYVVKFFGLGSLTRIAYVIENSNISKENITFITLQRNQPIVEYLEINALYIRTSNPFRILGDVFSVMKKVWKQRNIRILDMERSSNLAGIFRIFLSIRKSCASFYFKPTSGTKGNQTFVSLVNKPAINAIAELFGTPELRQPPILTKKSHYPFTVIVNVNAGTYLPQRMFPAAKFAELIVGLHAEHPDWIFILTGLKSETNRVHAFKCLLENHGVKKENIQNLSGQQSLTEMLAYLESAQLMITNDSGPLHCAQLLNVKTVGIWGPTSAELVGYPDSHAMLNLVPSVDCYPCFLHPKSKVAKACDGALTCFHNRDTQEMVNRIKNFITVEKSKGLSA